MCVVNEMLFSTSILGNNEKKNILIHAKILKHTLLFNLALQRSHSQNMLGLMAVSLYIIDKKLVRNRCHSLMVADTFFK